MSIPFKKYGYEINPITDEIKTPMIFLVNRQLNRIGELAPVQDLSIDVTEINQADEISFSYHKASPCFDILDDLCVVEAENFGFFEIAVTRTQDVSVTKQVTGTALGITELSNINISLEVNTEDDIARTDYDVNYPTIFYRGNAETNTKAKESSLLHRILTFAPHYSIGYVSPTLYGVQRTFSWSGTDIMSAIHDIEDELNCVFDIHVERKGGKAQRVINVYDLQYCEKCYQDAIRRGETLTNSTSKFRTIINGICQNCNSSAHISDIGIDSGIYISTNKLTDSISIHQDNDSLKNCFKVSGGDDLITSTVQGLNPSASGKIMSFSDAQKKLMSRKLVAKLEAYQNNYDGIIDDYEALLTTQYNALDIRLYLQSGKMPDIEKEITTTDAALYDTLKSIKTYFNNKFYISRYSNYYNYPTSSGRTSVYNMFSTFIPEGYNVTVTSDSDQDTIPEKYSNSVTYRWYGKIKFSCTGSSDDYYTLFVTKNNGTYVTSGTSTAHYTTNDAANQSLVNNFYANMYFADQSQLDYLTYIKQYSAYLLSTVDLTYENEQRREWDKYGYNSLKAYADGYQKCIEALDEMLRTNESGTSEHTILNDMRTSYASIQSDILLQMNVLEDQIFAVCSYLGSDYASNYLNDRGEIVYAFKYYKGNKSASIQQIFNRMVNSNYTGGYNSSKNLYTANEFIGTKPFICNKCNSSNVAVSTTGNVCRNCGATDVSTYCDIMENVTTSHATSNGNTLYDLRNEYQRRFDARTFFGDDLYKELLSFIREDSYENSNFTSDGLSNVQVVQQSKELLEKAKQELAKACTPQYEITTPLSSIVAQKSFEYNGVTVNDNYSEFKINNYVHAKIDTDYYKMRISSFKLKFPMDSTIDVTYSNVTNCKVNTADNIKEIIANASSIATSYKYVASQADKGAAANANFDKVKSEGLNAAMANIISSSNQDVVIDDHGILLRKKIDETGSYSPYQTKIIDRNIVMTDDSWNTSRLAIGLGKYNGNFVYGVWADLLVGDLLIGKTLKITNDTSTVVIDSNGITLDTGAITWSGTISQDNITGLNNDISGLKAIANDDYITQITKDFVQAPYIKTLNLEVGNEIIMGSNAQISWGQVTDQPSIPDDNYITKITKNTIDTEYLNSKHIIAGSVAAENISGDIILGKKLKIYGGGDGSKGNATIIIDGNGITLDTGAITWSGTISQDNITGLNNDISSLKAIANDDYITKISRDSITTERIKLLHLEVGNEIAMGSNAQISWSQVTGTNNVACKDDIPDDNYITKITKNTIDTEYLNSKRIIAGSVAAENITGTEIKGITFSSGVIKGSEIKGGTITGGLINGSFIKGSKIEAENISGTINSVTIKGSKIEGGSINTDSLSTLKTHLSGDSSTSVGIRPLTDGAVSCGSANYRWSNVYSEKASNNTSDRNDKNSIKEIPEKYEQLFHELKPVIYKFNNGDRVHVGAISQDVKESMDKLGISDIEFGGYCRDQKVQCKVDENGHQTDEEEPVYDEDGNPVYIYGLRYGEFIMLNTHMIQKAYKKIDEQQKEIDLLKGQLNEVLKEINNLKVRG